MRFVESNTRENAHRPRGAHAVTVYHRSGNAPRSARNRGSMLLLGLMFAGAMGVYFSCLKAGPARASADVLPSATVADAEIDSFLSTGPTDVQSMDRTLRTTQKLVQQMTAPSPVAQVPLGDLKTNPFRDSATAAVDPMNEIANRNRVESQRQSALRAVQTLQLQSVIVSDKNRSCMINNGLYLEGQPIDQFTIERISPGSVIVRSGVYRFELKQPQR